MSFPRYPKYKQSGVEWLGEVPEHWDVCALRHSISAIFNGISATQIEESETTVPVTRIETISFGTIDESRLGYIEASDARRDRRLQVGDVLFSNINSLSMIGNCAYYFGGREIYAGMNLLVLRPNKQRHARWLYWLIRSPLFRRIVESLAKPSVNQASIPQSTISGIAIGTPPLNEQLAIASFLDRETAKIDALIAEQQRLIELLQEKRQAVISHAVTKGLNPNVPMKDSGIEWLGEVPAHWIVKDIRYFAEVLRGKFTHRPRNDPAFYDGEYPFVQTGDITGASKYITGYGQTLNERGISVSKQFPKGTLVMAIAANIGDVAILDFPAYFPDSIVGLVPNVTAEVMFLYYLMRAMKGPMVQAATISTQMNLNVDQICSLTAACPPLNEQRSIGDFLDARLDKLQQLEAEAEKAITLLQERRSALISAAVTGQIDVRGLAPREAA
jgi:type I restriction enzyme S subunit